MVHAALLLLMLEAANADLVFTISLKRSTKISSDLHAGRPITPSLGQTLPIHSAPMSNNVRYASNSDRFLRRSEMTRCAKSRLMHCSKTASLFDHLVGGE
jgi:hypothetical protein